MSCPSAIELEEGRADPRHVERCAHCQKAESRIAVARESLRLAAELPVPEVSAWPGLAAARWSRPFPLAVPSRAPRWPFVAGLAAAAALLLVSWHERRPAAPQPSVVATAHRAVPSVPSARLEAVVTLLGGHVGLTRDGQKLLVDATSRLRSGDAIDLAGGARLAAQWSDGSGFLVDGPARLVLDWLSSDRTSLRLERGHIDVRVRPGSGQEVAVVAPRHIVSVHGTWFLVAAASDRTTVEVLEGVVEVAERDGSSSTLLRAPARAVFGVGSARTGTLTADEATRLRAHSELNLLSLADGQKLDALAAATSVLLLDAPAGATVAVDGVTLGVGSLAIRRPPGRHLVEVAQTGFSPSRRWVDFDRPLVALPLALEALHTHDVSADDLARTLSQQRPRIQSCYERGLKRDPQLSGTVSLRLEIGKAGRVRRATVEHSTLADQQVVDCLVEDAQRWTFPGENVTIVYPLVLRPQH